MTLPSVANLTEYDWILLNTSAGKDSLAMIDVVVEMAREAGVADRVVAVHADLGRVEWKGTRELAERQALHYGIRFEVVRRQQSDLLEYVETRGMWPSSAARFCTSDLKTGPVRVLMTRLTNEAKEGAVRNGIKVAPVTDRPVRILNCLGLRAQESPARAKKPAFEYDERASTKTTRHVDRWLPIHDWSVRQVWERIRRPGVAEIHYAYGLGMPRVSCVLCVLASQHALVLGAKLNPELAQEYLAVEQKTGHRFRNDVSMAEIVQMAQQPAGSGQLALALPGLGEERQVADWVA